MNINLRAYKESDYVEIADLFHASVHAINTDIYSEQELEAWAPTPPDYKFWRDRFNKTKPLVAVLDNTIVGFVELEMNGHIDCFYVHKDFQGLGIGRLLLQRLIDIAVEKGIAGLEVEASKLAIPLFNKLGFELLRTNLIDLRGQVLSNYSMSLTISSYRLE